MDEIDFRARSVVHGLNSYKPGTPIEEVKRKLGLKSVIKLASNENAFGTSPKALAALAKAKGSINRYPDASCFALRKALCKKLDIDPSKITVGNGSDEIIVMALRAFIEPGDEVVIARPTFLIYEIQAKACAATVRMVPLKNYRYDLEAMKAAVSARTKLIFIANPDNPTGSYITKTEFEKFMNGLPEQAIVFMDEAYYEFVTEKDYPKTLFYVDKYPLIISRSFSKIYGMAGLRVGYGIASEPIIMALNSIREPFNVNSPAQAAACAALKDDAFLRYTRKMTKQGMEYLTGELNKMGLSFISSVTNFLLIRIGPKADEVAMQLLKKGVIVREMSAWNLSGFIRVTVGKASENRRFIEELKSISRRS